MSRLLLDVADVGKVYPPAPATSGRFRAFWRILTHGRFEHGKRVLQGLNFEVRQGQSVAVIGSNGAGKSTLLKLLSGVMVPSEGTIESHGRISALLELGAGFEPDYSGLENLRMNAAFLGLTREQVELRLDDILEFADIGEAIHEPIKHYSSGMVVRLGFAIVASVRPDLLITDEILAVGDESFQKKCIRWVEQYLKEGGTLLMVSHNMYHVQKLCRFAIWLEDGRVRAQGDVFEVTQAYLAWHERHDAEQQESERKSRDSGASYRVEHVDFVGAGEQPAYAMGDTLALDVQMRSPDQRPPVLLVGLVRADGTPVYGVASDHDDVAPSSTGPGRFRIRIDFPALSLLPGGYICRLHALDPEGLRVHDTVEHEFLVTGRTRALGLVELPHRWPAVADESR
ncbi:MAG: ABC transporter ATP-binding protein [Xanthomonadaceae bacterium]|nr:ABC transporter ATP-binding protein [Xanthomonadaceae bacterium]